MPTQRRPPMPKLSPIALSQTAKPKRSYYLFVFFLAFTIPLFVIHLGILDLPFFWDELGQFVPTALDLMRDGAIVTHSAIPNVHPPGVEAYLAIFYRLFGFSILSTRLAMLLVAGAGLLVLFLLAIELSKGTRGAPAFLPPILLLVSPLFYIQSMMAQLDMPAMALTLLALLLFIQRRYGGAAMASTALVLVKETGLIIPLVFAAVLIFRKTWRAAGYFSAPFGFLALWLIILHHNSGYWLGDPGFAHYNVEYALHPVRVGLSVFRRLYYLFVAEFRWVGTVAIVVALWNQEIFKRSEWRLTAIIGISVLVLVSTLGGAELERYLLPVLPLFYIAISVALTFQPRRISAACAGLLLLGLAANLFWNPPYPFPFENNLAMVDFVRLQQVAAGFAEDNFPQKRIATAWPYTSALRNPDYGFVHKRLRTVETGDFSFKAIRALPQGSFDVLITYTRTWAPERSVLSFGVVQQFLRRFYQWQPEITANECEGLGLYQLVSWQSRGQQISIYVRGARAQAVPAI